MAFAISSVVCLVDLPTTIRNAIVNGIKVEVVPVPA